ncbi:MAG: METTL5 family protein [Candidatus Woesearchaeota archaeon]|nr:METTL5 family protein [Candidatus Woesearchaeota archaeon]
MQSKKELAVFLSKLKPFEEPNPKLEQYPTDAEVAASVLWDAYMAGNIEGKHVADFGCGTGILGIGALALGARHVAFLELDSRVFPVLMENLAFLEHKTDTTYSNYDIVEGNVASYTEEADTILQNPPFGTRNEHADTQFLEQALRLAPLVYSFHKTTTKEHISRIAKQHNAKITNQADFDFPLKQTMAHHKKTIERVAISCFTIER